MKTVKTLVLALIALFSITVISSCKREGCTDPDATNYDSKANSNDGSCHYEGSMVFWYNSATADSLYDYDSFSLTYYIDGVAMGAGAANVSWNSAPSCGQNSAVTITKNLGTAKHKTVELEVVDQDGYTIWLQDVDFTANTCTKIQLVF